MSAADSSAAPLPTIYALSPPHGEITDINHGAYVVICAWIMMCFFTVCVSIRLFTRFVPVVVGGIDDILSGLSMIFGIAQTVAIHVSASNGLGQHQDALSAFSFAVYAKSYYAASILYLVAVFLAKISLVFFIIRLSPAQRVHHACYGVLLFITVWAVTTVLVTAFQCNPPRVWNYEGNCSMNIPALYYATAATDILTDLAVIILPAYVIWGVQIPNKKKFAVIGVFSSRIAVVICSAIRIASISGYVNSGDRSWDAVTLQTWTQIIQCLSIITACTPCLKPFLDSLESGFMDLSMKSRTGATYGGGLSNQSNSSGRNRSNRNNSQMMASNNSHNDDKLEANNSSYMMSSMQPKSGLSTHTSEYESKDSELINSGRYLDLDTPERKQASRQERVRSESIPESERVLTAKSSDDYSMIKDDGIRVTREVEVRHEAFMGRSVTPGAESFILDDKYDSYPSRGDSYQRGGNEGRGW